ncbi:MAG: hypothetical protein ACMUIL_11820 [bacterium]
MIDSLSFNQERKGRHEEGKGGFRPDHAGVCVKDELHNNAVAIEEHLEK